MEALLVINGIFVTVGIFLLKEFLHDFKDLKKTVNEIKGHTSGMKEKVETNQKRIEQLEQNKRA